MSKEILEKNYGLSESNANKDLASVNEARAMQEVQAAFIIAKRFPRDEDLVKNKVINACKKPDLAEKALYAYPRGKEIVRDISIRLAEVMQSAWGNCASGVIEVSQQNGISILEAFAIDYENNNRHFLTFHVPHVRKTKEGIYKLTDPRDVYEHVANHGARRKRACILALIPLDIKNAAKEQCSRTLMTSKEPIEERIKKITECFGKFGVTNDHLKKRLGHDIESATEKEILTLRTIYNSIKEGIVDKSQFFDIAAGSPAAQSINDIISEKKNLTKKKEEEQIIEEDLREEKTREVFLDDPEIQEFLNEMNNS